MKGKQAKDQLEGKPQLMLVWNSLLDGYNLATPLQSDDPQRPSVVGLPSGTARGAPDFTPELDVIRQRTLSSAPPKYWHPGVRRRHNPRRSEPTQPVPGVPFPGYNSHAYGPHGNSDDILDKKYVREDYTLLIEQLTQRYNQIEPPSTARPYSGIDFGLQDQFAADASLKGVRNQRVAYEVMNKDLITLSEALKLVEAHEHNYRATLGQDSDGRARVRRISWADDNKEVDINSSPAPQRQREEGTLADELKQLRDQVGCLQLAVETLALKQPLTETTQPDKTEQHRGRSPNRAPSGASQHGRFRSPSPSPSTKGAPYLCGETSHFKRDCSRSSPHCLNHRTYLKTPAPEKDFSDAQYDPSVSEGAPLLQEVRYLKPVCVLDLPEHLGELFTSASEGLNEQQQDAFLHLLWRYQSLQLVMKIWATLALSNITSIQETPALSDSHRATLHLDSKMRRKNTSTKYWMLVLLSPQPLHGRFWWYCM
ncbi:hypothetical protein ABVT39_016606 [Epinephelus coioides]